MYENILCVFRANALKRPIPITAYEASILTYACLVGQKKENCRQGMCLGLTLNILVGMFYRIT
jgi:hypothetical protein